MLRNITSRRFVFEGCCLYTLYSVPAFSLFKEISLDSAVSMGGGISLMMILCILFKSSLLSHFATILPHRNKHMEIGCESPAQYLRHTNLANKSPMLKVSRLVLNVDVYIGK